MQHAKSEGKLAELKAAARGSLAGSRLFGKPRLPGSYFSTSAARLQQIAARRGVHHVDNEVSLGRAS